MPNYVRNIMTVFCSPEKKGEVELIVKKLILNLNSTPNAIEEALKTIETQIFEEIDIRTKFTGDKSELSFDSPWECSESVQDAIFEILVKIDSNLVMKNVFIEEADQFWGVRFVFLEDGTWDELIATDDPSDEMNELNERSEIDDEAMNQFIELRDESLRNLIKLSVETIRSKIEFNRLVEIGL